jgi:hypothetical protein
MLFALALATSLWAQGKDGGRIHALRAGRTSFMLSTSGRHVRLLLHTHRDPGALELRRIAWGHWRPQSTGPIVIGAPSTGFACSFGFRPSAFTATTTEFDNLAAFEPYRGHPVDFLGLHATAGQPARALFAPGRATADGYWMLDLPHWMTVALIASALAFQARAAAKHASHAPGTCTQCGYDLRASADRCPECGRAIAAPAVQSPPMRLGPGAHIGRHAFAYAAISFLATFSVLQWIA